MADAPANGIEKLSMFLPRKLRLSLEESMIYAQVQTTDFLGLIGSIVLMLFIVAAIAGILTFLFSHSAIFAVVAVPAGFFAAYFLIKSIYLFLADAAAVQIEKVLPDMLMLTAANLRAGMIPESSFLASIKPEFGKLNLLLTHAAIEVQGGKDFKDALSEMANRTTSKFFKDTMRIIGEALRSGAELHVVLENLATNILQNESIRNDMKAQVRSYALFIFMASTIAAPLLYGVSSFLITILDSIGSLSSSSTVVPSAGLGVLSSFSLPNIPGTLILVVATINVLITTTASALLQGILNTGNARDGLRSIPIFVLIGLGIFFAVRFGVSTFFATSSFGGAGGI